MKRRTRNVYIFIEGGKEMFVLPMDFKNEIVANLTAPNDVGRIILFGSHARGTADAESDIDIVVILNKKGISRSYAEMVETRMQLSKRISGVRKKVPVDLLAYTQDEWDALRNMQSDFVRTIQKEGIVLA